MLPVSACTYPWTQCTVRPEQGPNISPCCFTGYPDPRHYFPKMLARTESLSDSWNSEEMRRLRREIAANESTLSVCKGCGARRYHSFPDYKSYLENPRWGFSAERLDNLEQAFSELQARSEYVESLPVSVNMRFGWKCNLHCIMCNHREVARRFPEELNWDWIIGQADIWRKVCRITFDGGEALAIPVAVKFLDWILDDDRMRDVCIAVNTNGMLLDRYNARFAGKKVSLALSLDSYGKYHEKIRRGSSWEKIASNVDEFLQDRESQPMGRGISVACTIMRSGLPGLPDLAEWCAERKLPVKFTLAEARKDIDLSQESFLVNPALLLETPEWRPIIASCAETLERRRPGSVYAKRLRLIEEELSTIEEKARMA